MTEIDHAWLLIFFFLKDY